MLVAVDVAQCKRIVVVGRLAEVQGACRSVVAVVSVQQRKDIRHLRKISTKSRRATAGRKAETYRKDDIIQKQHIVKLGAIFGELYQRLKRLVA
jgi:hypothetical protein